MNEHQARLQPWIYSTSHLKLQSMKRKPSQDLASLKKNLENEILRPSEGNMA